MRLSYAIWNRYLLTVYVEKLNNFLIVTVVRSAEVSMVFPLDTITQSKDLQHIPIVTVGRCWRQLRSPDRQTECLHVRILSEAFPRKSTTSINKNLFLLRIGVQNIEICYVFVIVEEVTVKDHIVIDIYVYLKIRPSQAPSYVNL